MMSKSRYSSFCNSLWVQAQSPVPRAIRASKSDAYQKPALIKDAAASVIANGRIN